MNFLETWTELDKLNEWHYANDPNKKISLPDTGPRLTTPTPSQNTTGGKKDYEVTYYNDGVRKSFTVQASSRADAEQIAWSRVDADSLYVTELNEALDETLKVVSDPDVLYHATEAVPLYKIFTEECLRGNVNTKAGINAVCLTTDADYTIYDYPCKIQLSRTKLLDDGYEFVPFDEFADDIEGRGESEERVLGDITDISKYTTAIYIDWNKIPIAQSANGDFISGAEYDDENNENESWPLAYTDFRKLLMSLKAKGIRILKKGEPMYGQYYLDSAGKLNYGELRKLG